MLLFDSHCHFDFPVFDHDRELVWRECNAGGIQQLIIPGVSPEQWAAAAAIANKNENIYVGIGLHPWWIEKNLAAHDIGQYLANFKMQLQHNMRQHKPVAVGECGLDAVIHTPLLLQQQVLDIHLQLACNTSLPLIIHCYKAHNELLAQLQQYQFSAGGVIHGFSGSYELAMRYWKMGFHLGIGGTITYERANKTREAVKKLPLESILLETDAPDMPLKGRQGERNTPKAIVDIAKTLAELRNQAVETIAVQTTFNSQTLFKISH